VGFEKRRWDGLRAAKELVHPFDRVAQSLAGGLSQDFNTIASGDDQSFPNNFPIDEPVQARRARLFRERETLAYFDGRGLVINSY
jgi:hypothetical protein